MPAEDDTRIRSYKNKGKDLDVPNFLPIIVVTTIWMDDLVISHPFQHCFSHIRTIEHYKRTVVISITT